MIEVEKKFLLNKEQEKRLLEGAEFLSEKVFTDIYYDTADFALTTNDKWLRSRGGKWELKLPFNKIAAERAGDLYDEIEDENEIKKIFGILENVEIEEGLEKNGYSKCCICKTARRKYKKQGFGIDIDFVDYNDDFTYELAEIELMVQDKSEMSGALEKIINFAKGNGLEICYVRGKVIEYFKRKKPEHFMALVKSGVVKPSQI
jgi:adenylate cyclase class IV